MLLGMSLRSAFFVTVAALAVMFSYGQNRKGKGNAAPAADAITAPEIMQSDGDLQHPTPRQECRFLIRDSQKRLWTLGIENEGNERLNATRQSVVLGRFEGVHWSEVHRLVAGWFVYAPTAVADDKGGLYIAWSEWNQPGQIWIIRALYFDGQNITPRPGTARWPVGPFNGNTMRPTMVMEANGKPLIAYELSRDHHFELHASTFDGKSWIDESVATRDNNFRPSLAVDKSGRTWLAWDRFTGDDYDVVLRSRAPGGKWSDEILLFAGKQDEQRPTLRVAPDGTVWVHTARRLAGIRDGKRVEMAGAPPSSDEMFFDAGGRAWFFTGVGAFNPGAAGQAPAPRQLQMTVIGGSTPYHVAYAMPIGYRAPLLDDDGKLWNATDDTIYRLNIGLPKPEAGNLQVRDAGALSESKPPAGEPPHVPHQTISIGGDTYTLFFGEQHTHLGEHPTDRTMEIWPDRFYLKAMRSGVLDFGAASEHDWQWMTASKYRYEQAYAAVFDQPGKFLAFTGYEWSGDNYRRRRFGDRTIVFPAPYGAIFRITDPESETPEKLHAKLKSIGAIDWAHHVGAPFATMDWTTHDPVVEPVMEAVSTHGVYETYDRNNAVPVWLTKPPVGKTSIQDGLGAGHRFGLVGSSDSHSGLSGYSQGMFGIYAKSLTREAIMQAFRARHTFAIRGGEPMLVEFHLNDTFMGGEVSQSKAPLRAAVHVSAQSPVMKIEIVRDGRYIYSRPGAQQKELRFDFTDADRGKYYYVRVWLEGEKYAWTSPVFVD
jgi:hypothetical protein